MKLLGWYLFAGALICLALTFPWLWLLYAALIGLCIGMGKVFEP
jgi:hypothetical protein